MMKTTEEKFIHWHRPYCDRCGASAEIDENETAITFRPGVEGRCPECGTLMFSNWERKRFGMKYEDYEPGEAEREYNRIEELEDLLARCNDALCGKCRLAAGWKIEMCYECEWADADGLPEREELQP